MKERVTGMKRAWAGKLLPAGLKLKEEVTAPMTAKGNSRKHIATRHINLPLFQLAMEV